MDYKKITNLKNIIKSLEDKQDIKINGRRCILLCANKSTKIGKTEINNIYSILEGHFKELLEDETSSPSVD